MEDLCDEDVCLHDTSDIYLFQLVQDVNEPLVVTLGRCHPDEVQLKYEKCTTTVQLSFQTHYTLVVEKAGT